MHEETANWIFLRGLGREAGHWGGFLELFRKHYPEARVMTPDLPGAGRLHTETSPTTIPEISQQVLAQITIDPSYDNKATTIIIGMSLGGIIACDLLATNPGLAQHLVLINSSQRLVSPFYRRLRLVKAVKGLQWFFANDLLERETLVYRLTSGYPKREKRIVRHWVEIQKSHPVAKATVLRQLLAAGRYKLPRQTALPPTLILSSRHDQLVHASCSEALARHFKFPHFINYKAGHDLPLDDPKWVLQKVSRWLHEYS